MPNMTDVSAVEEQLASVFAKYGASEGALDKQGFTQFWCDLGVLLDATESCQVYSLMAQDAPGQRVTLKVIHQYLIRTALAMDIGDGAAGQLLHRLLVAEREGRSPIQVKAFIEYLWTIHSQAVRLELKRQMKEADWPEFQACSELAEVEDELFDTVQAASGGGITEIYGLESSVEQITSESSTEHAQKLKNFYIKLQQTGTNIWQNVTTSKFAHLTREGANQEVVMQETGSPVKPVGVGLHSLTDLYHHLDGKLPEVVPQYVSVKAKWNSDTKTLHFADDFEGVVPTEIATPDSLRYYGCSIANYQTTSVEMVYPGLIHNFTYSADYLDNYVKADCGDHGASLERHAFPHLDCPSDRKSGVLVIGKYVDEAEDQLQVTGFEVPPGQVVYIPPNVIHTNNYLQGTWITMLADQGKPIDTVHMVRASQPFSFIFDREVTTPLKKGKKNGDGQSKQYTQNTDVETVEAGNSGDETFPPCDISESNVMTPPNQDREGSAATSQFDGTSLQGGGDQGNRSSQLNETSNTIATASHTQQRQSGHTKSWLRDTFLQLVFSLLSAYILWYMWANMMDM